MPQEDLEDAVIDSVAASFEEAEVEAAIERALELLEERRQAAREGRSSHEEVLRIVRAEEGRLIQAVKQGQELNALVAALHNVQERRRALEDQLATLSSGAIDRLPDAGRLRAAVMKRAADVRRVVTRREPDVRRVLQSVVTERLEFTPFNDGETRGYQFYGTGSYAEELLGDTCPTSNGGPKGTRSYLQNSSS